MLAVRGRLCEYETIRFQSTSACAKELNMFTAVNKRVQLVDALTQNAFHDNDSDIRHP